MTEFEKQLHSMFDHIWECEIDHPVFQDTVGELMSAVIQCYNNLPSAQPKSYEDAVSREKVFEYFVSLWECIGTIMDRDEWEDVCKTTVNELPSAQPSFSQRHENDHVAEFSKMDCISRKAAIDAIRDNESENYITINNLIDKDVAVALLENLPSAQPEIVRCKECKHHWIHRCMDSMPTEICDLSQTFYDPNVDFCSLAERRTDE